ESSGGLKVTVRSPSNYDPTRAYRLIVAYPPAGFGRTASENFYDITSQATARGYLVAYSDHIALSRRAVVLQARDASTVAKAFCINASNTVFLGHSDGGSMAEGIPAFAAAPGQEHAPHVIIASAAGITREDLASVDCPAFHAVMIIHNRTDELFPDF